MDAIVLVALIIMALILAALDSIVNARHSPDMVRVSNPMRVRATALTAPDEQQGANSVSNNMTNPGVPPLPPHERSRAFTIPFSDGRFAPAIRQPLTGNPQDIVDLFGLVTPRPTIFITGGASQMTPDDIAMTQDVVEGGIAAFAERYNITVIDGGTEAGVMQMIGAARQRNHYKFPLIGVAPVTKVSYPGFQNPQEEAILDEGHSHFVLVEGQEWGDESQTIVDLTRTIAAGMPMIGVLINGGKIAEKDVYIATAQSINRIPILVLDGSGRTATNIANAFKTGQTASQIIHAIIAGGDIRLTALKDGKDAMYKKLQAHFNVS